MRSRPILLFSLLFISFAASAQTRQEWTVARQRFEGLWWSKKDHRYMRIFFDTAVSYITINDWKGKERRTANIDAYKAFIEGDRLVLPRETEDHHAPYCDLLIRNNHLWYRCESILKKDNKFADSTSFVKLRD